MINVGDKTFPGGEILISIVYNAPQGQTFTFVIPKITKDEPVSIELHPRTAIAKGCASFLFKSITADDGEDVKIFRDEGEVTEGNSFWDIFIDTYTDLYTYYGVIVSAIALGVLIFFSIAQLIVLLALDEKAIIGLLEYLGIGAVIFLGVYLGFKGYKKAKKRFRQVCV